MNSAKHELFLMILKRIVYTQNPDENWKKLEEMEQDELYTDCCSMNNLRTILNCTCPMRNVEELPKLLTWFSKFPETATTSKPISEDIATCMKNSIEHFKANSCLPELIEVIYENRQIYLPKTSNHSNFCKAVVELLSYLPEGYDHRNLANIKNCLMFICKNDHTDNLGVICFSTMCENLIKNVGSTPSSALIIVFQLVDEELWRTNMNTAVERIIKSAPDERKLVDMLSYFCNWLHYHSSPNMSYLSAWLTLFFNSLEGLTDTPQQNQKIHVRVADTVFPHLLKDCFKVNSFFELEPEMNVVLLLITKVGSLNVYHEIMEIINLNLKNIETTMNFMKSLIQSITIMMHRFPRHESSSCERCEPVIYLIHEWSNSKIDSGDLCNVVDFNPQTYLRYKEENQKIEDVFPSTSTGQGKRNTSKCGLANMGNTCYMNSVLQALVMTQQFCRKVLLYETSNDLSNQSVLKNLQKLFALLKYSSKTSLVENQIIQALRPAYFVPGHQQDSSEFLCYLLDVLYEQEKSAIMQSSNTDSSQSNKPKEKDEDMETDEPTKDASSPLDEDGTSGNMTRWITEENLSEGASLQRKTQSLADFTQGEELTQSQNGLSDSHSDSTDSGIQSVGGEDSTSSSASSTSTPVGSSSSGYLVQEIFGGELKIIYQCRQCDTESHNTDQFRDLQLCFLENLDPNGSIKVQELIDSNYFMPEDLTGDNKYRCDKCGGLRDAQRRIKILQAPAHLILTLKHFRYDNQSLLRTKLRRKVIYDDTIKLPVFDQDNVIYDLYAAVVHFGDSMDYGHYIAYASDAKGQWYKFNDNWVEETTLEDFKELELLATPYILFYKKRTDTPEPVVPNFASLSKRLQEYVQNYKLIDNQRFTRRSASSMTSIVPYKDPSNDDDDNDDNQSSNNLREAPPLVK